MEACPQVKQHGSLRFSVFWHQWKPLATFVISLSMTNCARHCPWKKEEDFHHSYLWNNPRNTKRHWLEFFFLDENKYDLGLQILTFYATLFIFYFSACLKKMTSFAVKYTRVKSGATSPYKNKVLLYCLSCLLRN